jgi:hypothetical protein
MNSAASLRASADMAETLGKHGRARFYREMADSALRMGDVGNRLYAHWARDIAERTAADFAFHMIQQASRRPESANNRSGE